LLTAAELIETALVVSEEPEAVDAARLILNGATPAVPMVKDLAAEVLRRTGHLDEIKDRLAANSYGKLTRWRHRTKLYPRDPVAWVEVALAQTNLGKIKKAKRAIQVAMQLAPNNRYVLRSAARFFLHAREADRAYSIIAKNAATPRDPWLIATELALAEAIDRDPKFYAHGRRLLDDQLLPRQTTELAGSMATKELIEGNRKKARRLFVSSMTDPNANALAQAEWASPNFGIELVSSTLLRTVDEADEARAFHLYREGHFAEVFVECEAWSQSEPYSIRPKELAATTANILSDFPKALEQIESAKQTGRTSFSLETSKAYALACIGKTAESEQVLDKLPSSTPQWFLNIAAANRGLIAFRRGQVEAGKSRYQEAIEGFGKLNNPAMALLAKAYFARECAYAGDPKALTLIEEIRPAVKASTSNALKLVFEKADALLLPLRNGDAVPLAQNGATAGRMIASE
jgi:tetratricopeptide (TPR) repeat protein